MRFIYTTFLLTSSYLFSETVIYSSSYIDVNSGTIKYDYSITINNNIITNSYNQRLINKKK